MNTPHRTAAIGTGHASESTSNSASVAASTNATRVAAAPQWSAFIGTGRAAEANHRPVTTARARP